ncbi:SapC family protein [Agaribacterium sp. ZY112]|uniref:SapC family protein n=1 Tax=Agaribacterium sp. ZY112 TaxID=3233574 RepID=UPI0035261936
MAKPELLDSNKHKNLKVITERGEQFGESVHFVPVVADELRSLVLDYPVVFMKDAETGRFGLFALFAFEPGENLFLEGNDWNATYVPLHVRRQPFMVAYQGGDTEEKKAVLSIDADSKRLQEDKGEPLFNDDGSASPYLENMNKVLGSLMTGVESNNKFVEKMVELELIESARIEVSFIDGEQKSYDGIYTINEKNIAELDDEQTLALHKLGYLQAAALIAASMGQIRKLIALKNKRLSKS